MRIRFDFETRGNIFTIPANYNHYLQAMIYKNLSEKMASFLHDHGFSANNRTFKLFTFSRLFGKFKLKKNSQNLPILIFNSSIHFFISSPYEDILQEFAYKMLSVPSITLNNQLLFISSVQVLLPPVFHGNTHTIQMLSPLTIRSTKRVEEGSEEPKTHYYSPIEPDFSPLLRSNLIKKFTAFSQQIPSNPDLQIKPLFDNMEKHFQLIMYQDYIVKGYTGKYELTGSPLLKQFAWDCGIGERNSQGFGMFDICRKE